MADKKAAAPAGGQSKKKGKMKFYMIIGLLMIGAPFFMPTALLLLIGLIPTLVALVTDNDPQKSTAVGIGAMNVAGITPFVLDLWMKGQTMENAMHILMQSSTWLAILGASFVGQLILFAVPQVMAAFTFVGSEYRLKLLKSNLEQLKTTWGPDVATTKPLDRIGRNDN